jgi:hypothetical protein
LTVFHGGTWNGQTPIKVNGIGTLGVGAYFTTDRSRAEMYGPDIIQCQLHLLKPLKIDEQGHPHPCVQALIQLGMAQSKAESLVEKAEETAGYLTNQIKLRALSAGYDGIMWRSEVVIWSKEQVSDCMITDEVKKLPL